MASMFEMMEEFHKAFGHPVGGPFTRQQIDLRASLIGEEVAEVQEELYPLDEDNVMQCMSYIYKNPDPAKLTKELADLLYVTIGTATAFGLPLEAAFAEVHRSNMSKLGEDGKPILREDGKVLKGPNYSPANMEQFFENNQT